MKDRILALIAERPKIGCSEIMRTLKLPQSRVSQALTELKNAGAITYKTQAHGRKIWSIAEPVKVEPPKPYVIEKTLSKVREIRSLFEIAW